MAFSYYTYTGDGTTTQFPVAFGYIRREHVLATVAGAPATFTFVNSTTIQMDAVPANGAVVRVYRQTPLTAPLVNFTDGATLVAADLDTNALQSIYTQQELDDSIVEGLADVIPNGDKGDITTSVSGTVWTIDSGAVVEAKVATGAITETKVGTGAITAAKLAAGAFTDSVSSTSTTTIATPNSVKTSYDLASAALPRAGGTMTGVIAYDAAQPRLVSGTSVASTSGTSIDFTGIPSWVKKITVMFSGVSTNGISDILLQLGDSGGIETTGYLGASVSIADANITTAENFTTGFGSITQLAANVCHGFLSIVQLTGDTWICSGTVARSNVSNVIPTAGSKTLSAALTQIRITTNGADTFDAGSINIMYEG
jgi:hypothetical protein